MVTLRDVRYSVFRYLASPIPNANGTSCLVTLEPAKYWNRIFNCNHRCNALLRNVFCTNAAINPDAGEWPLRRGDGPPN